MSQYLKNFQIESLLVEVIYLTSGALANAWFQSFTIYPFWGYESSFIDTYNNNTFIYIILFFGLSYVVGLFLREVGEIVHKSFYFLLLKIKPIKGFVTKHFMKAPILIGYEELIPKIEAKLNKNLFYFLLERNRARYIGHKIVLGFLTINFLMITYGYSQEKVSLSLVFLFLIMIFISCYYVAESSKRLGYFIDNL